MSPHFPSQEPHSNSQLSLDRWQQILREGRLTLLLSFPLVAGQLSQMLMGVADTVMIGRLGITPLAACAFANTLLFVPMMFGIGMSMAVSIQVSQARGSNEPAAARSVLRHGFYIAVILGLITVLGAWAGIPLLSWFGQDPGVVAIVPDYFLLIALSLIPMMGGMIVKNHADAMNRPWPAFWILLGGVLLNVLLNWLFIYGNLGFPRMGLEGAGIATVLARCVTVAGLLLWIVRAPGLREWIPYHWFRKPDWAEMRQLVNLGFPASCQLLAEISAFVAATLVIGNIGKEALAAHQVAINCAATVFMVPLGVSMALTVRVGETWGAQAYERLRPIIQSGWLMVCAFTLVSALTVALGNEMIAGWFLSEPETLAVTAGLLMISALFQFADAMQIVSSGALRGLNDVKAPAWIAFGTYWGIALPVGWVLAHGIGLGVYGMWWGITLGLGITAVILARRIWRKVSEPFLRTDTARSEPIVECV